MGKVQWNDAALGRIIGKDGNVVAEVERCTKEIWSKANALSAGYTTKLLEHQKKPRHGKFPVGGTQAAYDGDVQVLRNAAVGIVHTANYAAMKDNAENNTLLKARG